MMYFCCDISSYFYGTIILITLYNRKQNDNISNISIIEQLLLIYDETIQVDGKWYCSSAYSI